MAQQRNAIEPFLQGGQKEEEEEKEMIVAIITLNYYQMLARSISRACFSVNWSAPFESVAASLKRQPPDYIRNNAHHIFSYMFDLIDGNRWAQVNTYLNHLNYRFVDRWELWERLGDEIDNNINKSIAIGDEQIFFEMLRVCKAVNYEITPSRHSFVYEHSLKLIE